ncbi:MAG: T9SS type A sorting domain-containing protein [Luteibaculaceae bacterium]
MRLITIGCLFLLGTVNVLHAQNLLTNNADFEAGNLNGFSVDGAFAITGQAATGNWAMVATLATTGTSFFGNYTALIPYNGSSNYRFTSTTRVSGPFEYAGTGVHFMTGTDWNNGSNQVDIATSFGNNAANSITTYTTQSVDILASVVNAITPAIDGFRVWIFGSNTTSPPQSLFVDDLRLEIISVLPVELTHFSAQIRSNTEALILWETQSETNSDFFEIHKSNNGIQWDIVGTIAAAGNSSQTLRYQFVDDSFTNENTFYRLKQVDFDGSSEIFPPFLLRADQDSFFDLKVFPNPASERIQFVNIPAPTNAIVLLSADGKVVQRLEGKFESQQELTITHLPKQLYTVLFYTNNRVLGSAKFIKH